ncbi:MAG: S-methyl-5-thioribose-1-phosphate isomerase [Clostridia bacterium]|nr:S-methyl-5-thioribose-1-phosphate isomerase [Clostridia bacterium]
MDTVWLDEERNMLMYIDQTKLPNSVEVRECCDIFKLVDIIQRLAIRGAPAIGVGAAIGLYAAACRFEDETPEAFYYTLRKCERLLKDSRPTAVNLAVAVDRMMNAAKRAKRYGINTMIAGMRREARNIYNEDIATCKRIGEHGATLLRDGMSVLTHCNAGRLAAVRYGTALAPIYVATEQGKLIHVFVDETRPLLQGARLTAFELHDSNIPVTLQCDNMAASIMKTGRVGMIFVGADRVAANGDTANKIGTSGLAIIAKHYGVPFYVCAPFTTIDFNCATGDDIVIEQRDEYEVTDLHYEKRMAPPGIGVYNPAFDVTPHELITGIITERGIFSVEQLIEQK